MSWRETFISICGPGLFAGITARDWLRILQENRFAIDPRCSLRAALVSFTSAITSACKRYENWRYLQKVSDTPIPPPVFIIGHWRSGTTHLHNLICMDERFAYPNIYQTLYPHTFISTEAVVSTLIRPFLPETRGFDNMTLNFAIPNEDEFALCVGTTRSPYMGFAFPKRESHYSRYLTMRDVPEHELQEWRDGLTLFLRKLTWKYQKPLVLKSPPHTCRIRLLLELFPEAKFVHIHRNPFVVFKSTRRLMHGLNRWHRLQQRNFDLLDEHIIRQYKQVYDIFLEERDLIPEGNFHEVRFDDLERDPLGQLRQLYQSLNLPDFSEAEPAIREYLDQVSDYKKNSHPDLDDEIKSRLSEEWGRFFDEWGYQRAASPVSPASVSAPSPS